MTHTVPELAARKYWVVQLESIIPADDLRTALASNSDKDYNKIRPIPAFGFALNSAVRHGRDIVIVTGITTPDDARQREHMRKAISRLCFLSPATHKNIADNMRYGDNITLRAQFHNVAGQCAVISHDKSFLDSLHRDGMKTVLMTRFGAPAQDPGAHMQVKIGEWLMFFMAQALENAEKTAKKQAAPKPEPA